MTTETLTFNKDNWSGETATITVDRAARTFKIYDYDLRWEQSKDEDEEDTIFETFKVYGEEWNYALVKATKLTWAGKPHWSDKCWIASAVGIERADEDPVIACAKVLFNTL